MVMVRLGLCLVATRNMGQMNMMKWQTDSKIAQIF